MLKYDDENQQYMKMTKDAILEGSSQQAKKDFITRKNGQGPKHLKLFLGNFFLHPINCDWHSTNILKPNCTLVMFILKKLVALMQMMPSNLRATLDDLHVPDFVFVQGVLPLNTMLLEKCQPKCEDANTRARGGVGCKNGRNELGCVIGCKNH